MSGGRKGYQLANTDGKSAAICGRSFAFIAGPKFLAYSIASKPLQHGCVLLETKDILPGLGRLPLELL